MERTKIWPFVVEYYEQTIGYWPDEKDWKKTLLTTWYLYVNQFTDQKIRQELKKHNTIQVSPEDLSPDLWALSLTVKGHFYFHRVLQLVSPAPSFSLDKGETVPEFWCVPKIQFSKDDLIQYFFVNLPKQEAALYLGHNDHKTIEYLINRFQYSFPDLEPLDVLLCSIDEMIRNENRQNKKGLISVTDYLGNTIETLRNTYQEAKARGYDKPRWPQC